MTMHDSGNRQLFASGAVRDSADDKPRPDLVSPFAMERLGEWLRLGAQKYKERNWEAGIPISRCVASLSRHLMKYQQGARDEDHMAAVMCNAMFVIHLEEMIRRGVLPADLLDMPTYRRPAEEDEELPDGHIEEYNPCLTHSEIWDPGLPMQGLAQGTGDAPRI
jgi:hypothetical protein